MRPTATSSVISGEALYYLVAAPEMAELSGRFFHLTVDEKPAAQALDRENEGLRQGFGTDDFREALKARAEAYYDDYQYDRAIQDFNRVDPTWDSTLRPTRIPVTKGQFGSNGQAIFSARQSRLGARGSLPAGKFDVKGRVEFDFYGRGTDGEGDARHRQPPQRRAARHRRIPRRSAIRDPTVRFRTRW